MKLNLELCFNQISCQPSNNLHSWKQTVKRVMEIPELNGILHKDNYVKLKVSKVIKMLTMENLNVIVLKMCQLFDIKWFIIFYLFCTIIIIGKTSLYLRNPDNMYWENTTLKITWKKSKSNFLVGLLINVKYQIIEWKIYDV